MYPGVFALVQYLASEMLSTGASMQSLPDTE